VNSVSAPIKDQISIIIPVLNEAASIGHLIKHLQTHTLGFVHEIIVVDGGSKDETCAFAKAEGAKVLTCAPGRAKQMNYGAQQASAPILYFLHADSFPPRHYDRYIVAEVNKGNPAGCFRMSFDHSHWWLRLAGWLTQFSWRACRGGDQSQFISKSLFEDIGGFDESYIIYEDNDLINKLYARNTFVVINKKLTTSARRYDDNGIWRLQYHFWTIYVKKWFGASPDALYQYYKKNIS
jgi:rSAM/selenodomain-associated transferase 2